MRGRSRLIGFVLTVLAFAVPAAQGNMITNGDFSSGLDGWDFLASGVGEAPLGETAANAGSGYLSMQADDAYYAGQQAVIAADTNLDFSADIRALTFAPGALAVGALGGALAMFLLRRRGL